MPDTPPSSPNPSVTWSGLSQQSASSAPPGAAPPPNYQPGPFAPSVPPGPAQPFNYQPVVSPPASSSGAVIALTIVMWLAWVGVTLMADFLGFMMFAFADSPGAGRAAQMMIAPAFIWFGFTFVAGAVLLFFRRWWTIALAFILAISPPFMIFAGYNLLAGSGGSANVGPSGSSPINPPPVDSRVPAGGFVPSPMKVREQPDFQDAIRRAKAAATQPTGTEHAERAPAATTQP